MSLRRGVSGLLVGIAVWASCTVAALASPYHGQVTFDGLPLPGSAVTVTATQGDKKVVAISDDQGLFGFADLADGTWSLDIERTGFAPLKTRIAVAPNLPVATFEMKLLTLDEIRAADNPVKVDVTAPAVASVAPAIPAGVATTASATAGKAAAAPAKGAAAKTTTQASVAGPAAPEPVQDATAAQANDGFLINGSVNNAATSQFSLNQAFGNNRNGGRWLYSGGAFLVLQNSALNARTFSAAGVDTPQYPYTDLVGGANFAGPLRIPHLLPLSVARAPYLYFAYQRTESKQDTAPPALMPTTAEVGGNLSAQPNVTAIYVPTNAQLSAACLSQPGVVPGATFPGNVIPTECISPVAQSLLRFYPAPNVTGTSLYNYQVPLATPTHTDQYTGRVQKGFNNGKDNVFTNFQVADTRTSTPSIFGFLDTGGTLNTSVSANWYHRLTQRLSMTAGYSFSRSRNTNTSYFANKANVEGNAGITGNYPDPTYWGPPGLGFSSGIQGLSDGQNSSTRPEQNAVSYYVAWNRLRHNMTFGGDYKRQEYNYLQESNPRGSLYFSGAQTQSSTGTGGSDFADFLLGLPDTSAIAYGNADKYLRQSLYDLYADDDFRVNPELSIHAGLRWEYGSPVTELKNRLVNLDVMPGFTNEEAVVATNPTGPLTGQSYPTSLIRPDYSFPEPRVGIAWRLISGSSLLVRAGYGIYNDASLYRATALAMAQQAPLSTSLSVTNSANCRLTIASPFQQLPCATTTADTFAVDPNFKVGTAQQWQLSVQRDLPFSLQLIVTYTGIKGTHGVQEIVPNSYAPGLTASPYGTAPVGYYYRDSEGDSTKESGQVQLRRRLRNGFTANLAYTYSKALDDDYSLGGQGPVTSGGAGSPQIAQDWTHPQAQRGLSTFDQRNVLNATLQYTTGMGLGGHTMLSGWKGLVYKEWTVLATINEASGMPLTPVDPAVLPGTSFSNILRANYVGGAVHQLGPGGLFLNPAAFADPTSGFGTAGRDSITGPNQFTLNASMNRGFRIENRYTVTAQIDANNVLNHVAYSGWNTTVGPLFGTVAGAGGMRSVVITLRARF